MPWELIDRLGPEKSLVDDVGVNWTIGTRNDRKEALRAKTVNDVTVDWLLDQPLPEPSGSVLISVEDGVNWLVGRKENRKVALNVKIIVAFRIDWEECSAKLVHVVRDDWTTVLELKITVMKYFLAKTEHDIMADRL
jgi:hypothetical protein